MGADRLAAEAARIAKIKQVGAAPVSAGPDVIAIAPARGPVMALQHRKVLPPIEGDDSFKVVLTNYRGRDALRSADAFDLMNAQVRRAKSDGRAMAFDHWHVATGRDYLALHERLQSAGIKVSDVHQVARSGGSGDFMEAYAHDSQTMRRVLAAIGSEASMIVRRQRPSARGSRANILNRDLVDLVCLSGYTLSAVLERYGWSVKGKNRKVLRDALCHNLERMRRYL